MSRYSIQKYIDKKWKDISKDIPTVKAYNLGLAVGYFQAYKNAKAVLSGNTIIDVPEDIVYQAQFVQGSGVWKKLGTETFCRK